MPVYTEVVQAARETITAILAGRMDKPRDIEINTRGGQTARVGMTDDTIRVYLPSLAHDTRLTRQEADRIVALIGHECCHVLHTDFAAAHDLDATLFRLVNWIEDQRIEALEVKARKLAGLPDLLSGLATYDYFKAVKARRENGMPAIGATSDDFGAVLATAGRNAGGVVVPGLPGMVAAIPAFARPTYDWAVRQLRGLHNTWHVVGLAREITQRLAQAQQDAQQKAQQEAQKTEGEGAEGAEGDGEGAEGAGEGAEGAEGDGEGAEGAGEGAEGAEADGEGAEGAEADSEGAEGAEADGEGAEGAEGAEADGEGAEGAEGAEAGSGAGRGGAEQTPDPQDAIDAWNQDDGRNEDSATEDMLADIAKREGDKAEHSDQSALICQPEPTTHDLTRTPAIGTGAKLRSVMPAPGPLRDQITRLITSQEKHGLDRYRAAGRLDRRALTRMSRDASNVFVRRTYVPGVDTAVFFLIDGSGSMGLRATREGLTRLQVAQILALHLSEAADAARGRCQIAMFRDGNGGVALHQAKAFTQRLDPDALGAMVRQGGTPLSPAIVAAARMLKTETATRRILLVLTDGECGMGTHMTRLAVEMAERMGVEVVGIGCGVDVSGAFPRCVSVSDMTHLAEHGLAALATALEGRPGSARTG